MNCEEGRQLLEEYFDGELAGAAAERVAAHLAACAPCAALYESLGREQEFYLSAEPEAASAASLWAGVSARLEAGRGGGRVARLWREVRARSALAAFAAPRFSPAHTAAAVLAAVALTAGVMKYLDTRPRPQPEPPALARQADAADARPNAGGGASAPAESDAAGPDAAARAGEDNARGGDAKRAHADGVVSPPSATLAGQQRRPAASAVANAVRHARTRPGELRGGDTPDALVREAERKYVAAIALLARDVRRRRTALDAGEAARFERTLAAVDRAIAETRRAARSRPADPVAAQYMLAAYSKKVDLLRDMASH